MTSLKKIYEFEVTPPADVWNNIALELDSVNSLKRVSVSMASIEMHPPADIWNRIQNSLDETQENSAIAAKLHSIEAEVPEAVWDNISRELDDQKALSIIEHKLSNLAVQPPLSVWPYITSKLDSELKPKSRIVPMHHGWLKYAAAACFVAIISVTGFFILNDNSSGNQLAGTSTALPIENTNVFTASSKQNQAQPPQTDESRKQQALAGIRTKLGNSYSISMERNKDLQNRYIILMTEEGNIVRMSKKMSNMADCIAGADNSCDAQISKWQKEMASSNAAASPDNFLDILDMVSEESSDSDKSNL